MRWRRNGLRAIVAVVLLVVAFDAWVRLAPSDPARWNTDPRLAQAGASGFVVNPEAGNIPGIVYPVSPESLMTRVTAIAAKWPRTRLLARDGNRATWISRTALMGYPDYTTIEAEPAPGGARLIVNARQRFGRGDFGVNADRVRAWLKALEAGFS